MEIPQNKHGLNTIPEVIDDLKVGKPIILVDDENRENEGDLIIPADLVTPEHIAFMAKKASGLICLSMPNDDVDRLKLDPMVSDNTSRRSTAFTTSIEAREGVTTGISAFDRALTIKTAINPKSKPEDLSRPGHVFPLRAKESILIRPGHTEGSMELSKMAGFSGSSVICEIMNDDGTMARLPELEQFSHKHNIKITTIKDLVRYKLIHDKIIRLVSEQGIDFHGKKATLRSYKSDLLKEWYITLIVGDVSSGSVPAYLHKQNLVSDVLNLILSNGKDTGVNGSVKNISEEGKGVIVFLCNESSIELEHDMKHIYEDRKGSDEQEISLSDQFMYKRLRNVGIVSQVLKDLNIASIEIKSSNLENIHDISVFGIQRKLVLTPFI